MIPGWLWTLAIAIIPVVVDWLQTGELSSSPWVPGAIIILGAVAKLIEVYRSQPVRVYGSGHHGRAFRFLLGG